MRLTVATAVTAVLVATAVAAGWAAETSKETTKPLAEVDALRLENADVNISLLKEREARIKEQAERYVQDIARRDGTVGWQLSAPDQGDPRWRWVKPPEPAQPNLMQEER